MDGKTKNSHRIRIFSVTVLIIFICILVPLRIKFPNTYQDFINKTADNYNVDSALVAAVIMVESGYKTNAKSKRGAIGLMQLMPSTASWCSQKMGIDFDEKDLYDAQINITIGCYYLSYLSKRFTLLDDVIAAYNAGEGNVLKWKREGIDIPFPETICYIKKVKFAYEVYKWTYAN